MIKKIYISTPSAQAKDIAEILRAASMIPQTTIDVGLGFDSPAQAGQYQRRIKEALLDAHADPEMFFFAKPKDSSALGISCTIGNGVDHTHRAQSETGRSPERPVASPITESSSPGFLEGKAVVQDLTTVEKASGSYLVATLLIVEGPEKGDVFQDWLRRFPPHGRLPRFADAFGTTPDSVAEKPEALIDAPVWVRRRTLTLPDGTSKTETFYYRVVATSVSHAVAV